MLALAVALGAVAFIYALHELGFLRVPVPGREWVVPADWVRRGFYQSAVVWGGIVGAGVFTRVPFAALPILAAWLFISGDIVYGVLAGALCEATRALSIYSTAFSQDVQDLVHLNQQIMRLAPSGHQVTGLFLAGFGTYLLAAPYFP